MKIYTDGACSGNPGPGAWAYVVLLNDIELHRSSEGKEYTTNNEMELYAVIKSLQWGLDYYKYGQNNQDEHYIDSGSKNNHISLYTDSQYVKCGIEEWIGNRRTNGRKNAKKKIIAHVDLWKQLDVLSSNFTINRYWVKGHSGNKYNTLVDTIARKNIPFN